MACLRNVLNSSLLASPRPGCNWVGGVSVRDVDHILLNEFGPHTTHHVLRVRCEPVHDLLTNQAEQRVDRGPNFHQQLIGRLLLNIRPQVLYELEPGRVHEMDDDRTFVATSMPTIMAAAMRRS